MREIRDETGRDWRVIAVPAEVAHRRVGAILGFRAADDPDAEPLLTTVSFNSNEAAEFAIRTMSDKEVLRRLSLASTASGRGV